MGWRNTTLAGLVAATRHSKKAEQLARAERSDLEPRRIAGHAIRAAFECLGAAHEALESVDDYETCDVLIAHGERLESMLRERFPELLPEVEDYT